jgi:hypothetical protein
MLPEENSSHESQAALATQLSEEPDGRYRVTTKSFEEIGYPWACHRLFPGTRITATGVLADYTGECIRAVS